ncbi:MAG: glycosyltransferase family 2 protein [Eubacterium sp.]
MIGSLISVIVPVYNSEKYLDKCIDSIVSQTYENLEIILIDDGSPDSCPQKCDEWAKRDSRIKVIHKENGGVSSARNCGLDIASGDYITFIDSDDFAETDMLEIMVNGAVCNDADIVVCGFIFDTVDGLSDEIKCTDALYHGSEIIKNYVLDNIRPEACSKLFKKSVIKSIGFNCSYGYAEDLLFNYYAFKESKTVACIDECRYHYLQDSGNSSTTPFMTDARAKSYKIFEEVLIDCKNNSELYGAAVKRFTSGAFAVLSRVMKDRYFSEKYYREIANTILKYKSDILKCPFVGKKYKLSVLLMSVSKGLYLFVFSRLFGRKQK